MNTSTPEGKGACDAWLYTEDGTEVVILLEYTWKQTDVYGGVSSEVVLPALENGYTYQDFPYLKEDLKNAIRADLKKEVLELNY